MRLLKKSRRVWRLIRLLNKTEGYGGYWDCSTKLKGLEVNEIFNKTEGFGGYNEIIKQNRRVGIKRTVSQNRRV